MSAKIGRPHEDEDRRDGRRAPNYFSRNMQFRMMGLVAALMLVIVLMVEAGKPKNWQWMWGGKPPVVDAPPADVNTKLPPTRAVDPQVGLVVVQDEPADVQLSDDALTRTIQRGWSRVWSRLTVADRDTLWSAVYYARHNEPLPAELQAKLPAAIESLDRRWRAFHQEAFTAVVADDSDLPADEAEQWLDVVTELERYWNRHFNLLKALHQDETADEESNPQPADETPDEELVGGLAEEEPIEPAGDAWRQLQAHLDSIAIGLVRDNTVSRYEEKYAWFRIFEHWQSDADREDLQTKAAPVGYLELFDQTDEYRGKPVRITGTVSLAYRVSAPKNDLGLTEYTVLWLKPKRGPNSPIVVYALGSPEGFPEVKHKETDRETSELDHEPVEITGIFFKRWAYRAQDGTRVAPMVLANSFVWQGSPKVVSAPMLPSIPAMAATVIVLAIAAIALSLLVWFRSRWRVEDQGERIAANESVRKLAGMKDSDITPNVGERLRRLEEAGD